MIVLGVTHPISLNNAACILVDGRLVAFAEEERFTRQKHAPRSFPENAIEACLRMANVRHDQVDITAVGFEPPKTLSIEDIDNYLAGSLPPHRQFPFHAGVLLLQTDLAIRALGKKQYFDHHLSHAASTLIPSRFKSANVISLDGWGGESSGVLGWMKDRGDIHVWRKINAENSWGQLYELVTYYLGFRPHSGEGKTMGLAPYGVPDTSLLPDFCEPELGLPDLERYRDYLAKNVTVRPSAASPDARAKNLAATLQHYYERSLVAIARALSNASGLHDFALAGGVALNCTGNGALARQDFVNDIFVQPASHDAGTALGAAILAHRGATGAWPELEFQHAYWGSGFSQDEVRAALEFAGARFAECDPRAAVARALEANRLVGLFQGRAEVGPRALGNRSILANPGRPENLDRVNKNVKRREPWRPLAPSVLAEHYGEFFEARVDSPYMLMAFQVRDAQRSRVPAVVHVDGSARPQSVSKEANPLYHEIISACARRTGLPMVLNTSFNLEDEPIVNAPAHAIATFFRSGLEVLVIGNFVIEKR